MTRSKSHSILWPCGPEVVNFFFTPWFSQHSIHVVWTNAIAYRSLGGKEQTWNVELEQYHTVCHTRFTQYYVLYKYYCTCKSITKKDHAYWHQKRFIKLFFNNQFKTTNSGLSVNILSCSHHLHEDKRMFLRSTKYTHCRVSSMQWPNSASNYARSSCINTQLTHTRRSHFQSMNPCKTNPCTSIDMIGIILQHRDSELSS